jgi:hypothetical protein
MGTVRLSELKTAIDKVFGLLAQSGDTVEFPVGYYYSIGVEELFRIGVWPTKEEISIGDLDFDLDDLRRVASDEREPLAYDLIFIANILRALGYVTCGLIPPEHQFPQSHDEHA